MAKRPLPSRHRSPAAKPIGIDHDGKLDEATLRRFVFQTFGRARRTQDSPVMPDVWLRYIRVAEKIATAGAGDRSNIMIDLLLTPWTGVRPGEIAKRLRKRLDPKIKSGNEWRDKRLDTRLNTARIALSDSRVVACVDFETLVRDVVPLTGWWQRLFLKKGQTEKSAKTETEDFDEVFKRIEDNVKEKKRPTGSDIELFRYAALVGFIDSLMNAASRSEIRQLAELAHRLGPLTEEVTEQEEQRPHFKEDDKYTLPPDVLERAKQIMRPCENADAVEIDLKGIFLISLNRRAAQTLFESRATVKADAAHRVFDINASGIVFAVIDGGIDATHPAFLNQSHDRVKAASADKKIPLKEHRLKSSRVLNTYDFTILRDIVAHASVLRDIKNDPKNPILEQLPDRIKRLANKPEGHTAFDHLATRNNNERDLDWEIVRPLIQVPHDRLSDEDKEDHDEGTKRKKRKKRKGTEEDDTEPYLVPGTDHGTHVAGILAADLRDGPDERSWLRGMCPELSLYDLRVFDKEGRGDEFAVLCAIEFMGWLNRDRANPVVHGVNLSLALAHDVDSFACGQTPICEACNHLVGAGTVVVAAAGNTGFEGGLTTEKQSLGTGYRAISITDPGNADSVITVGSTHRRDPHLYGVSYFSARGPTGDGRRKPDILAPGEKITSTVRGEGSQRMDGTSMAAPHVAGAAAMLMARNPELIGRPLRIKEILMQTATDLNREPSFQGAGLVDVLRALQSV
jgi:serine protease AprX